MLFVWNLRKIASATHVDIRFFVNPVAIDSGEKLLIKFVPFVEIGLRTLSKFTFEMEL